MIRNHNHNLENDAGDRAVSERLAKLGHLRPDCAAFDAKFKTLCPPPRDAVEPRGFLLWSFASPLRALAACLIIGLTLFFSYLAFAPQTVLASPERMAAVYQEVVGGRGHSMVVTTIDQAKAALRDKWPQTPAIPDPSGMPVMSCCVHEVGQKRMACVTFVADGSPVTLALADAKDVRSPEGEVRVVDGERYLVQSQAGVNMVMTERDDTWLCLMGPLPTDRLVEIVHSIRN